MDRRPQSRAPDTRHHDVASDRGGERAAFMYTLIGTAKLNDIDPQAWLADVLRRIADHPASRLHELLPWHWKKPDTQAAAA
jgi:transposase